MNELALKQLVASKGWEEAQKIFAIKITEHKLPKNFATSGKTAELIALECMAREQASKIVEKCIKEINNIGNKKTLDKESWDQGSGTQVGSSPTPQQISPLIGDATKGLKKI